MNIHRTNSSLRALALTLVAGAPLLAQAATPAQAALSPTGLAHAQGIGIGTVDGTVQAHGDTYEASFTAAAVEITPLLGSEAPMRRPLRLELTGIRRGATQVPVAPARPAELGDRVEYDRGNGITERYVVRTDGLKQSFVFAAPVDGNGDLIVSFALTTAMAASTSGETAPLSFRDGQRGGIDIGAVVGIDAANRRVRGQLRHEAGRLDLVLPAAFVAEARFPLELDPLIGGVINTGRSFSDGNPDVAYDQATNRYLVVYESAASATDVDVWAQFVSGAGARVGNAFPIATNTYRSERPTVGNCNFLDSFLVCWQDNGVGNFDIKGVAVAAATGALGPVATFASGNQNQVAPDVGGDSYDLSGPGLCLVTYDDQMNGIYALVVDMSTSPLSLQAVTVVSVAPDPLRNNPRITKNGGDDGRWFVIFEADAHTLGVAAVDYAGSLIVPAVVASLDTVNPPRRPDIAGDGSSFMYVFERQEPGSTTRHDVFLGRGSYGNGSIVGIGTVPLDANTNEDETDPQIAHLGPTYLAGWVNPRSGGTRIELTNVMTTFERCGTEHWIDASGRAYSQPTLTGRRESGDDSSEQGLVPFRNFDVGAGAALLESRLWTAHVGGPVTTLAPGCGLGGTCGVNGPAALGNASFQITLAGADPNATFGFWLADLAHQPLQTCGSCTAIGAQFQRFVPLSGGQASVPIALPCSAAFAGLTIDSQWLILSTASQPCPAYSQLQFSSALRIVLAD